MKNNAETINNYVLSKESEEYVQLHIVKINKQIKHE
jgi:hypothetical protein